MVKDSSGVRSADKLLRSCLKECCTECKHWKPQCDARQNSRHTKDKLCHLTPQPVRQPPLLVKRCKHMHNQQLY